MALINTSKLDTLQLTGETGSFALASDGSKTLHIVTKFYVAQNEDEWTTSYTEYQITHPGGLDVCGSLESAIDYYNEL